MPSPEASRKNLQKATNVSMRKAAIKVALKLKGYLTDSRIKEGVKEDLEKIGIEVKIKESL
jgi:predicted nucleotide-binding protein (sugar kinase/HSP70/actin superfamily)